MKGIIKFWWTSIVSEKYKYELLTKYNILHKSDSWFRMSNTIMIQLLITERFNLSILVNINIKSHIMERFIMSGQPYVGHNKKNSTGQKPIDIFCLKIYIELTYILPN